MEIKSATLNHEPTSFAVLFELLSKGTDSITEEATNGRGVYDTPACFLNHHHHLFCVGGDRLD